MASESQFAELAPYIEKWGKPTLMDRVHVRCASSFEDLKAFHAAMLPRLREVITFLDQWPLEEIPDEHLPLSYAALAMCEVDNSVNRWKDVLLPEAQDPRTVVFKTDYFDMEVGAAASAAQT